MIRHLTVSALILRDQHVLLIDHRKAQLMLPPGGHVEPDEDPVQTVHREVYEEVGLKVEIVTDPSPVPGLVTIPAPFVILEIENVNDPVVGPHNHIDLVYVCRPLTDRVTTRSEEVGDFRWVPYERIAELNTPAEMPALVRSAEDFCRRHSHRPTIG
jgi:8-oxo-dGTP pyrophosphatase MutT (NUDIX family)